MATLNEMTFNIRNTPQGGRSHRAKGFSDRHIWFMIRACRAAILHEEYLRTREVLPQWEQDLGCVTLTTVDQADCPSKEWGEVVKMAVIPRLLDLNDGNKVVSENPSLTFFGLIDKRTTIYLPSGNYGVLDDHVPFKPVHERKAMMIGQKIYVHGKDITKLCVVNIRGVWYDPTLTTSCAGEGMEVRCFDTNKDCYPFPPHLEQMLYDMVWDRYIMKGQLPEDVTNDERRQALP